MPVPESESDGDGVGLDGGVVEGSAVGDGDCDGDCVGLGDPVVCVCVGVGDGEVAVGVPDGEPDEAAGDGDCEGLAGGDAVCPWQAVEECPGYCGRAVGSVPGAGAVGP